MVLEGCLLVRGYLTLSSCSLEEGSGSLVVLLSVSVEIKGRDQCPFPAQSSVFLLLLAERDVILGLAWLARVCVCVCVPSQAQSGRHVKPRSEIPTYVCTVTRVGTPT